MWRKDVFLKISTNIWKMSESNVLEPPKISGMVTLNRDAFRKTVNVPCVIVSTDLFSQINKHLKRYYLKLENFKSVLLDEPGKRKILLNPDLIQSWSSLPDDVVIKLAEVDLTEKSLENIEITLKYENWTADSLLKAILPKENLSSYSIIGHIVHVNIRDHHLEYRKVIGEILLDKVKNAKTVVNKTSKIDSTYRNFEMELLCGEPNMVTQLKENGFTYEFDFSKVYWNSRLSTEHERIIKKLNPGDVLFDVFCGVGPFAIPIAKKKCLVYCNDLNPESYKWLLYNIKKNKVNESFINTFSKDGKDFILTDIKDNLLKIWSDSSFSKEIHIVMNLPAIAIEFVKYFENLVSFNDDKNDFNCLINKLPTLHIYCFVSGDNTKQLVYELFHEHTGLKLQSLNHTIHYVRNVSPKKDMYRIEVCLPESYLIESKESSVEPVRKKLCL